MSERCVLCLEDKRSPIIINCGHSFCAECLDLHKSYRKYKWSNQCPMCRTAIKANKRSTVMPFLEKTLMILIAVVLGCVLVVFTFGILNEYLY
ncbi:RING finger protein 141-like [Haematobia irritans]|uniref:RING finger protein 141-like n=1 Tax=Haematobia irritans TaxID=7368 RepID=UPI003F5000C6